MEIYEIFAREVVKDYFTANIKAEVILDTILTPVISEILTTVYKDTQGEMRLIAKEFPILKKNGKGKKEYRSWNADYLMCDDEIVYWVELKTTQGSVGKRQKDRYNKHSERFNKEKDPAFAMNEGYDFICLLNHVSKTGILDKEFEGNNKQKKCGEGWISELEDLYDVITHIKNSIMNGLENKKSYADRAKEYLIEEKAAASKKYLFTAGQIIDHKNKYKDRKWWNYTRRKVIYLVPANEGDEDDAIDIVTFKDIIQNKDKISKEISNKKDNSALKEYWDWVVGILESVFKEADKS